MMTQFDIISDRWDLVNKLPNYRACQANAEIHIKENIRRGVTRVLDLGCGTGHYSRLCIDYGAREVVGLDASRNMIHHAAIVSKAEGYAMGRDLKYRAGNVLDCRVWNGGEYDLILGMWLFCFAKDKSELLTMFQTITLNLKPGGVFIGCQFKQSNDPVEEIQMYNEAYLENFGLSASIISETADGIELRLAAHIAPDSVEFNCYHLKSDLLPSAAVAAGMDMLTFELHEAKIPVELKMDYKENIFEDKYGRSRANFSLLVVKKKSP